MKTNINIFSCCLFISFMLVSCKEKDPEVTDPLGVIVLAPLNDDIPYKALGSGKIVFDRIHPYRFENNGFYVLDIDKKTTSGFRLNSLAREPSISPDGTRIACSLLLSSSSLSVSWDIYLMNTDGSSCYQVSPATGLFEFPSWTTDGSKIMFYNSGTDGALYIQSPVKDATDRQELVKFYYPNFPDWLLSPLGGFSWSPAGTIVLDGCAGGVCGIMGLTPNLGKSGVTSLLPNNDSESVGTSVYSPDGLKIAFISSGIDSFSTWINVKTMNADATGVISLCRINTFKYPVQYQGVRRNIALCWSPDGSKILFTAPLEEYGCHIFVINSDGTGLTQVTKDIKAYDLDVSWSR